VRHQSSACSHPTAPHPRQPTPPVPARQPTNQESRGQEMAAVGAATCIRPLLITMRQRRRLSTDRPKLFDLIALSGTLESFCLIIGLGLYIRQKDDAGNTSSSDSTFCGTSSCSLKNKLHTGAASCQPPRLLPHW
jgi:hypothetical protein